MPHDEITTMGKCTIQHGKANDRIYIMKMGNEEPDALMPKLNRLAKKMKYSKIFAKVPDSKRGLFLDEGFVREGAIPGYFGDSEDLLFLSKFLSHSRKREPDINMINDIVKMAVYYNRNKGSPKREHRFVIQKCRKADISRMAELYKKTFATYPFPIHEEDYLESVMDSHVDFYGVWEGEEMISLASTEKDEDTRSAEMTDFATLAEHRGKGLAKAVLKMMEDDIRASEYRVLYTIARAVSPGMNIVFGSNGYNFGGTLIKNTQISGNMESMNVWYKLLDE